MANDRSMAVFLRKRRMLMRLWHYVGPVMLLGTAGLAVALYIRTPLLINPGEVIARIETGSIEQSSLQMMAIMLPLMVLFVFFLLLVVVVLMYAAFSNEKRYLEIAAELKRGNSDTSG